MRGGRSLCPLLMGVGGEEERSWFGLDQDTVTCGSVWVYVAELLQELLGALAWLLAS